LLQNVGKCTVFFLKKYELWDVTGMVLDVKKRVWERGGMVMEWWVKKRKSAGERWDGEGVVG
jgi:hypothetical protein